MPFSGYRPHPQLAVIFVALRQSLHVHHGPDEGLSHTVHAPAGNPTPAILRLFEWAPWVFQLLAFLAHGKMVYTRNEWIRKAALFSLAPEHQQDRAQALLREWWIALSLVREGWIKVCDAVRIFHECIKPYVPLSQDGWVRLLPIIGTHVGRGSGLAVNFWPCWYCREAARSEGT
jgi:hypothetical protein